MSEYQKLKHTFSPIYDRSSEILILGSFPSVKSREVSFFYGNKQNRFWLTLAAVLKCDVPQSREEKKTMLLKNNIALWDVIAECEIIGSDDSSIRNVTVNDISLILNSCEIQSIYANGAAAGKLYKKYAQNVTGRDITVLPSTSPANAACSLPCLIEAWSVIVQKPADQ